MSDNCKSIVIIGATSGIGRELAKIYLLRGCKVGLTGRRTEALREMKDDFPENAFFRTMDVRSDDSVAILDSLIEEMGGMDVLVYCAGRGDQNPPLDMAVEMDILAINSDGFARSVIYAFNYFKARPEGGHIVDLSSVAGIRPLRQSPAYSSTKKFQSHYMSCLAQKSNKEKLPINFTTIFPGFIRTGMLKYKYPLVVELEKGTRLIAKAIDKKKRRAIVPGRWRFIVWLWSMIPNQVWERIW